MNSGNTDVHFDTIWSSLNNVEQLTRNSMSKYDEHQRGIDTVVDMAIVLVIEKFELTYINISDIVVPGVTLTKLMLGNFKTLTRTRPLEIYRKNDTLTVDATFKIRPRLFVTIRGNNRFYRMFFPKSKLTAFAKKIEVRVKLNFDYSVELCRIELIDINFTTETLTIRMMDQGRLAALFNSIIPYAEQLLTPQRLLPPIKNKLQNLLDSKDVRSEAKSLRPIFLRV